MMNTAAPAAQSALEAGVFTKRIGYTTYRVGVHFSGVSKETAQDKILRLVKNEAAVGKGVINQWNQPEYSQSGGCKNPRFVLY